MRVHLLSPYFILLYTRMAYMTAVQGTHFLSAYFISVYTWSEHMSAAETTQMSGAETIHFLSAYFISVYTRSEHMSAAERVHFLSVYFISVFRWPLVRIPEPALNPLPCQGLRRDRSVGESWRPARWRGFSFLRCGATARLCVCV